MGSVSSPVSSEGFNAIAIGIDKDKNSQAAVKWAVDHLGKGKPPVVIIHVRTSQTHAEAGQPKTEAELEQLFLPYRGFCARKGVSAQEVILHDPDVGSALVNFIKTHSIGTIVVGSSTRNALTRRFKQADVPTSLGKYVPDFCKVYVISKGKLQFHRPANRSALPTAMSTTTSRSWTGSSRSSTSSPTATTPRLTNSAPWLQSLHGQPPALPSSNSREFDATSITLSRESWTSKGSERTSTDTTPMYVPNVDPRARLMAIPYWGSPSSEISESSSNNSFHSIRMSMESLDHHSGVSASSQGSNSTIYAQELEAEMKRLKLELQHTMDRYKFICDETSMAKRKNVMYPKKKQPEEEDTFEHATRARQAALTLAELEKQMSQQIVEMEVKKKKIAEQKEQEEDDAKKGVAGVLSKNSVQYRKYTLEEIEVATDYFSMSLKIGEGGYGPVYRAVLNHTTVAIKVLRPDVSQGLKQFQKEVDVLGRIRHPNMVLLLGACPEYGCLIYEYMENGSLEDRLFCKNDTPPIPWKTRFKIAWEIATALLYLHQAKPEPMVHRDLKPANILLDGNYVSKIGDVGLARLVPATVADSITQYHMTAAAGTFCYIDPEYQQTGLLGTKSDIYSLGVMFLQIITARPPMALAHHVEQAIESGTFAEVLDPLIDDWPVEDALSVAQMSLKCCELRKRDRPDLATELMPELLRLRDLSMDIEPRTSTSFRPSISSQESIPGTPIL